MERRPITQRVLERFNMSQRLLELRTAGVSVDVGHLSELTEFDVIANIATRSRSRRRLDGADSERVLDDWKVVDGAQIGRPLVQKLDLTAVVGVRGRDDSVGLNTPPNAHGVSGGKKSRAADHAAAGPLSCVHRVLVGNVLRVRVVVLVGWGVVIASEGVAGDRVVKLVSAGEGELVLGSDETDCMFAHRVDEWLQFCWAC